MAGDVPPHPDMDPDQTWLLQADLGALGMRLCIYLILGLLAFVALYRYIAQYLPGDDLTLLIIWVGCLLVGFVAIILSSWRWRLLVGSVGVWEYTFLRWRFRPWQTQMTDPKTGVQTTQATPLRISNPYAPKRRELLRRLAEIRCEVGPPPPPLPDPQVDFVFKNTMGNTIRFDSSGMTHPDASRRDARLLRWGEMESIELIVSDHYQRRVREIRVAGASDKAEFKPRVDVDGPSLIATLRDYLPEGSLILTAEERLPRDVGEARRRALQEVRSLRGARKWRKIEFWLFCTLWAMPCVMGVFELWTKPTGIQGVGDLVFLFVWGMLLLPLFYMGLHRTDPRRGGHYRAYQQFKAQML